MVLLDMRKAFDSINHNILFMKLRDVGISEPAVEWFNSYLSRRCQVVRIHSTLSNTLPLTSGVPQASILGPLLFSVYLPLFREIVQLNVMKMIPNFKFPSSSEILPV